MAQVQDILTALQTDQGTLATLATDQGTVIALLQQLQAGNPNPDPLLTQALAAAQAIGTGLTTMDAQVQSALGNPAPQGQPAANATASGTGGAPVGTSTPASPAT